jgi:hypothetical protein
MRRGVVKAFYGSQRAFLGGASVVLRANCVLCWFPHSGKTGSEVFETHTMPRLQIPPT